MTKPVRMKLSRAKGFNLQAASMALNGLEAVKVSRPTVWGNPFVIGAPSGCDFEDGGDPTPLIAALSREQVIDLFREMIGGLICPEMHPHGHRWMREFKAKMRGGHPGEMARAYLRGRNLACACDLDQPCHASVLLEISNA